MRANDLRSSTRDAWTRRITHWLTLLMHWVAAHWLLMANVAIALYVGVPVLAPVLAHSGYERAANMIHLIFKPLCHQLPERSFFLYGRQIAYSYQELSQMLGGLVPSRYQGGQGVGFKVAVCQRCVAIYLTMLVAGLSFAWARGRLKALSVKQFVATVLPIAIDGLGQLSGLWTSTWWSRVLTGGLFGLGCFWLTYPHLERGMSEVRQESREALKEWRQ